MDKPIRAKPSLYAVYFYPLKEIAFKYGFNLVIHGSLNRDMDLIAIPWANECMNNHKDMVQEMIELLGVTYAHGPTQMPQGRLNYIINLNRRAIDGTDPQYYIDLSITPSFEWNF